MSESEREKRRWERIMGALIRAWERFNLRCPRVVSLIEYAGAFFAGRLKPHQAMARLSVVALIQFGGVKLTFWLIESFPGHFDATYQAYWQDDCLRLANVLFWVGFCLLCASVLGYLTLSWGYFAEWESAITEGAILLTFAVNIVYFSLAMVRTGGPAHSFFAQLVPMQLSGILILEQQKTMMTSRRLSPRWRALLYAGFTILVWLIIVGFSERVQSLFGWKTTMIEGSRDDYEIWTAAILFCLGVAVTALAYFVTPLIVACARCSRNKSVRQ